MDYRGKNKEAWEEAYDNRRQDYDRDLVARLSEEEFPYLDPELLFEMKKYEFRGKTCAQFCSNNGRELLNLSKLGLERGVGFDIAGNMVRAANSFADELGLPCSFIETDILEIGEEHYGSFDFGLITIGALTWFRDLHPFFMKVSSCLREGGVLFIHEMHPFCGMLAVRGEDNFEEDEPGRIQNSYFKDEPWVDDSGMNYMTGKEYSSKTFTSFQHTLGSVINAMSDSGLYAVRLKEYERDIAGGMFAALEEKGLPLSYVLVAEKSPGK